MVGRPWRRSLKQAFGSEPPRLGRIAGAVPSVRSIERRTKDTQ
jgi:hypothetical protein